MTLKGFLFILASALFHVLWNTSLKMSDDKPSAVLLMMVVTVAGCSGFVLIFYPPDHIVVPSVILSAFAAGFFFFIYQYCVALSLDKGDLTFVYPLTVTGPVYIAIWSYFLIGERISLSGGAGILLVIYGAVTLQTSDFQMVTTIKALKHSKGSGALTALLAAFFYSFGAVADKIGVMTGSPMYYTLNLCIFMLVFHLLRMCFQHQGGSVINEFRKNPAVVIIGGIVMLLSFITFRIGLEHVFASYASALRQVSTLFGLIIGYTVFRESLSRSRVISSFIIALGAILLKIG